MNGYLVDVTLQASDWLHVLIQPVKHQDDQPWVAPDAKHR